MIADLMPYADYKESGLSWLGHFARRQEISADILAVEKEAEGLLAGTIAGEEK